MNPCGLASADNQAEAFKRALAGDRLGLRWHHWAKAAAEADTAQAIIDAKLFVECTQPPTSLLRPGAPFKAF